MIQNTMDKTKATFKRELVEKQLRLEKKYWELVQKTKQMQNDLKIIVKIVPPNELKKMKRRIRYMTTLMANYGEFLQEMRRTIPFWAEKKIN